jgi:thiol-disulfide isomerase/thioredoxin
MKSQVALLVGIGLLCLVGCGEPIAPPSSTRAARPAPPPAEGKGGGAPAVPVDEPEAPAPAQAKVTAPPERPAERPPKPKQEIDVLLFTADFCHASRDFAPTFDRWSRAHSAANVRFRTVRTEEDEALSAAHRITHVPTVIVKRGGVEVARFIGGPSEEELLRHLR